MKRSLLSFLSIFFISTTFAQQLTGYIKDEWGNAVELASVSLYKLPDSTLSNGVLSDKKGHFQLKNLSAGTYSLHVKFIGFNTFKKSIQVVSGQNISVGNIVLRV